MDGYAGLKGWTGMRARNRLSAAFVRSAPAGKHCDGAGLWLVKRPDGGAQWMLRVTVHGRRREMGLGAPPAVSLAGARDLAERWRSVAAAGRDPIKEREAEARAARREDITLAVITADAFEARKSELKGDGKAGRWLSPLSVHVLPKLGCRAAAPHSPRQRLPGRVPARPRLPDLQPRPRLHLRRAAGAQG